ncbi:MAG TPA: lytic murein transglycosylase [Beijerinckiaceae bacterium]|nr:lytic murein transglycosylase [Beijerinckiaceae bacterium]
MRRDLMRYSGTVARPMFRLLLVLLCLGGGLAPARADFAAFLVGLWPEAQAAGVSRATFDGAFKGVTPDQKIVAQTKKQSEFVRPIWDYVEGAITSGRVERGREAGGRWSDTVSAVESRYGVDRRAVMGIWGMETNFGSFFGNNSVIRALATLAYVRYRDDFFRKELIIALKILEEGHVERSEMRGSWAGAMGHTQFMPSSFMKYAVDHNRDGRKDIWDSIPDALASTANYLKEHGWQTGLPWGMEVELPHGIDLRQALGRKAFPAFSALGIKRASGQALPRRGEAALFLPAGIKGPAFLLTDNFKVIKAYNSSDAYALAVGLLGDVIYGGEPVQADWPKKDKRLTRDQGMEVQRQLTKRGLYQGKIDGRFGEQSRESIIRFQKQAGLVPDGYATPALLERLKLAR